MSGKNTPYFTRNYNSNLPRGGGPQTAVSNATNTRSSATTSVPKRLSPSLTRQLPSTQKGKSSTMSVRSNRISLSTKASDVKVTPKNRKNGSKVTPVGTIISTSPGQTQRTGLSGVSDNQQKEISSHTETVALAPSNPEDPWHQTFIQMRSFGARMDDFGARLSKLDNIDVSTAKLASQLEGTMERTTQLEHKVDVNDEKIAGLGEEMASLKALVEKQGREITSLKQMKKQVQESSKKIVEDTSKSYLDEMKKLAVDQQKQVQSFNSTTATLKRKWTQELDEKATSSKKYIEDSSQKYVKEMTDLVSQQREQVDSFQTTTAALKKNITKEVDEKVDQISQDFNFDSLINQAFNTRHNLILSGMPEDGADPFTAAKDFITKKLGIKSVGINEAYRIGKPPDADSNYRRPIVIQFATLAFRNKVWKKRTPIAAEDGDTTIRIHADLPKKLREHVPILYKIQKTASNIQDYKTAAVRNYQLVLHGKEYAPQKLELLPFPLRPSTISAPRSEDALAFFSRYTVLSNHFQADFKILGLRFHSVEQFLALRRAQLSGKQSYIFRALRAKDPVVAKSILNDLKKDHPEEWNKQVQATAEEGVRAKFLQNPRLKQYLIDTSPRQLGEASQNSRWGIGMTLEDPNVLDISKWSKTGNLLGRTLMKIRAELIQDLQANAIQEPDDT